jgi:hypothetical protein
MPTQDRILTGSASRSAGARCLSNEKLKEGKAKRTANKDRVSECQKEIAETRSQKALARREKKD